MTKRPKIKFRAWDQNSKSFLIFEIRKNYFVMPQVNLSEGHDWEQFTGFRDVNGSHVWEGDIIAWPDNHENHDNDPMVVVFEYGAFIIDGSAIWDYAKYIGKGKNKYHSPTYELEELEIVGNIHETPELLPPYLRKETQS